MAMLKEEFALIHPPLIRRQLEWFRLEQYPGESFTSFIARFDEADASAEIESMTAERLRVVRLVDATRDQELRDLFLELKEPTLEQLQDIGYQHEGRKRIMAQLFPKKKSRSRGGKNRR